MSQTFAYTAAKIADVTEAQATMRLRWCDGRLQQLWRIIIHRGGRPLDATMEWRDVPSVTSDGAPGEGS